MNVYNGMILVKHPDGPTEVIGRHGGDRTAFFISAHDEGEARARLLAKLPLGLHFKDRDEVFTMLTIFSGVEDE